MKRRTFIAGLGSAAAWPVVALAQQAAVPVVGFLNLSPARQNARYVAEFLQNLEKAGYVEGKNVVIEYRWGDGQPARLADLAADLVSRQVAVIVALDSDITVFAAKAATSTIPIVFAFSSDPIRHGLVASLNRPGGNMTGLSSLTGELAAKRLDLIREMAPLATTVAYLTDPRALVSEGLTSDMLAAARAIGRQAIILEARSELDIDAAFATLVERGAGALVVGNYVLFRTNKVIELAARYKIPAIGFGRAFAVAGGLMSYALADYLGLQHQIGSLYVAKILRGAKPADLPVQQPTKFELIINLKTAKALGLTIPETLLATADEVIQ